jgi:hypothetical protein
MGSGTMRTRQATLVELWTASGSWMGLVHRYAGEVLLRAPP